MSNLETGKIDHRTKGLEERQRYPELDALRGLAALTVVFFHGLNLTVWGSGTIHNKEWFSEVFLRSPLAIVNAGHQAVILFFVLSGYVLSLPYLSHSNVSYPRFIIRRICRLYLPYLLAIFMGISMRLTFARGDISGLWSGVLNWSVLWRHLLLIDSLNQNSIDPVIWSLVQEMRVSLFFPLLLLAVKRWSWKPVLAAGFLVSCFGIALHGMHQQVDFFTNYYDTLHYVLMFIVGALLAKYRHELKSNIQSLPMHLKLVWVVAAFVLYTYSSTIATELAGHNLFAYYAADWLTTIGAVIWIILSISVKQISIALRKRPLVFVGRISYSVYLHHLLWFLTWISISWGRWPIYIIWALTISCTLCSAVLAYYLVERPAIQLGRFLTNARPAMVPANDSIRRGVSR